MESGREGMRAVLYTCTKISPVVSKHGEGINVMKLSIAPPTKPHPYISHKYLSTLQE